MAVAAILDFEENEKKIRRVVPRIKIIGSNKLYWIYLSIDSLVVMVLLPISSGQGTVF